ncbi:hypothetical protein [Qaidamihabitans albus]|uniref:hypothetical protein n=1 Tax=Qaidamihabitans albus TaxID=2795733 RepID=UPI0018F24999|nr:hypothetical protein [Qaidamihabitans albus]
MTESLSDLFATAQSPVVEWNGEQILALYEFDRIPDMITVDLLAAKKYPVQGLKMKIHNGLLKVNDVESRDLVLWRDTRPDQVAVRITKSGARTSLKFWNVWRGGLGVTQAWLGNSAMRVRRGDTGDVLLVSCSDGQGDADFDDLQVRLTVG